MYKTIATFFLFTGMLIAQQKTYHKSYDTNGILEEEGWVKNGLKNEYWITYFPNKIIAAKGHFKAGLKEKYWYFYQPNGALEKEGHFSLGLMSDWWVFYDEKGAVIRKIQYEKDKKKGYCIQYEKGKIIKIEKYLADVSIGEWEDLKSFELENDLKNLLN
jgi:antitoxin component YwqK of YwqJK toxin-antitoxin module